MQEILINIKPLSVNKCWRGRRFKTPDYINYSNQMILMLPRKKLQYDKYDIDITFGFSSRGSDIDNPTKPLLDILQFKYNFNDRDIYRLALNKEIVKKGDDFIKIKIKEYVSKM